MESIESESFEANMYNLLLALAGALSIVILVSICVYCRCKRKHRQRDILPMTDRGKDVVFQQIATHISEEVQLQSIHDEKEIEVDQRGDHEEVIIGLWNASI